MPPNIPIPVDASGGGGTATLKQPPPPDRFSQALEDHFETLDANDSGAISRADIAAAIDDPTIEGDVACAAATLWLQAAFDEVDDDDDKRLTKAEVANYNRLRERWANDPIRVEAEEFLRLKSAIKTIEQDLHRIDQRAANAKDERQLKRLKRRADTLEMQKNTLEAVKEERHAAVKQHEDYYNRHLKLFNHSDTYFEDFQKKIALRTYKQQVLFASEPRWKQVQQEKEGTCTIAAAVASLCHRRSGEVRNMIRARTKGYKVKLHGRKRGAKPIRVPAPTDAQIALYDHAQDHGLWMTILYLAIGEWAQTVSKRRYRCYPEATLALTDGKLNNHLQKHSGDDWADGHNLSPALRLLLSGPLQGRAIWSVNRNKLLDWARDEMRDPNNWIDYYTQEMSMEELHKVLRYIERHDRVATAGRMTDGLTDSNGNKVIRKTMQTWLEPHAYAIIGYTPDPDNLEAGTVKLYNPHGTVRKTVLEEFHVAFDNIAWEGKGP